MTTPSPKHPKVSFRCTKCGLTTIVEVKRSVDQTVVISPMPSFARADASTQRLRLLAVDDGLRLPDGMEIVLTIESGPQANKSFPLTKGKNGNRTQGRRHRTGRSGDFPAPLRDRSAGAQTLI